MGGANGLIVACVVAVWAAYFVPLVLRRYDDASSSSSLETLSPLSRVIARSGPRDSPAEQTTEPVPDRKDASVTTPHAEGREIRSGDRESIQRLDREALSTIEKPAPASRPTSARAPVSRTAAIIAARRRRRTLLTLLTALVVVGGLAVFSVVQPVWLAVPAGLVVAWLVACRVQVRGERGLPGIERPSRPGWLRRPERPARQKAKAARTGRSAEAKARRGTAAEEEQTVIVQLDDPEPERPHVMERAELTEDALDDQIVIAVPSVSTAGEALWDPLPVTLPTYVTKPRAGRTVRTIDFDAPGAWTSGHVEGEDVQLPGRHDSTEAPRRASGE